MAIPKIIHYVWVGPNPFPEKAKVLTAHWRALLPDYEFILWDERNIDFGSLFLRQAHGARAYNRVANYARYAALDRYGGFYMDHDVELLKPLEPLRDNRCVLGFQTQKTEGDLVNTAFMGAEPGHPFIRRALDALGQMNGAYDWRAGTGPGLLTRLLRESDDIKPAAEPFVASDVTLDPQRYFYPYEWTEQFSPECVTPDTFAIHYWDHTWRRRHGLGHRLSALTFRTLAELNPSLASGLVRWIDLRSRTRAEQPDLSAATESTIPVAIG